MEDWLYNIGSGTGGAGFVFVFFKYILPYLAKRQAVPASAPSPGMNTLTGIARSSITIEKLDKIEELGIHNARTGDKLLAMHDVRDPSGVPVWYAQADLTAKAFDKVEASISKNTEVLQRLATVLEMRKD